MAQSRISWATKGGGVMGLLEKAGGKELNGRIRRTPNSRWCKGKVWATRQQSAGGCWVAHTGMTTSRMASAGASVWQTRKGLLG
jgi:hypothetical protein